MPRKCLRQYVPSIRRRKGRSNMRTRKCKKELESYEIANRSIYGWQTEKYFNDDLFDSSSDTKWYEEEEEPPAKKMKRLREAEKAAASHSRQSYDCDDY